MFTYRFTKNCTFLQLTVVYKTSKKNSNIYIFYEKGFSNQKDLKLCKQ